MPCNVAEHESAQAGLAQLRTGRLWRGAEVDRDLLEWNYGNYEDARASTSTPSALTAAIPARLSWRGNARRGRVPDRSHGLPRPGRTPDVLVFSSGHFAPSTDGWSRRQADIADRDSGCRNWADNAPTAAASGTTAVRTIAVIELRARNSLHRPERALIKVPAVHREGRIADHSKSPLGRPPCAKSGHSSTGAIC
jgi:hypothetical protein